MLLNQRNVNNYFTLFTVATFVEVLLPHALNVAIQRLQELQSRISIPTVPPSMARPAHCRLPDATEIAVHQETGVLD